MGFQKMINSHDVQLVNFGYLLSIKNIIDSVRGDLPFIAHEPVHKNKFCRYSARCLRFRAGAGAGLYARLWKLLYSWV